MALARKPRQLTFKGLKRRMEREERRVEQKELGRWYGVNQTQKTTISATQKGGWTTLQEPGGTKSTLYAVDLLINLYAENTTVEFPIRGALMVCHVRKGQAVSDFMGPNQALPTGDQQDALARPRAFLPFVVLPQDTSPYQMTVIPYRLFRGRRITLLTGEQLSFAHVYAPDTPNGLSIHLAIHGRYRYIESFS